MSELQDKKIGQIVIVVNDIEKTAQSYCRVFDLEAPRIEQIPLCDTLPVYYKGELTDCDAKICTFDFNGVIFELMQPGKERSVWRDYLDKYGEGVFDIGFWVDDRMASLKRLSAVGAEPVHVGFFNDGTYSLVDAKEALGVLVNLHCHSEDFTEEVRNAPRKLSETNY